MVNNAADHKQICVKYETVYFSFGGGGGVWCNLLYPPGIKRMNFSHTVIGLHVCYNQEILVNNAANHKQICVIYETVYFSFGGRGLVQFIVPSWHKKNEF